MVLLDRARWHITSKLDMSESITPIFLPSRVPELNPCLEYQCHRPNFVMSLCAAKVGAPKRARALGSAFAPPEYPCTRSFSNRMPVRSSLSGQRRGIWPTTQPRDPRRLRCPDPRHYLTHVAALASIIYRKPRSRGLGATRIARLVSNFYSVSSYFFDGRSTWWHTSQRQAPLEIRMDASAIPYC